MSTCIIYFKLCMIASTCVVIYNLESHFHRHPSMSFSSYAMTKRGLWSKPNSFFLLGNFIYSQTVGLFQFYRNVPGLKVIHFKYKINEFYYIYIMDWLRLFHQFRNLLGCCLYSNPTPPSVSSRNWSAVCLYWFAFSGNVFLWFLAFTMFLEFVGL